ncbi:hypothetical protein LY76DRAFT_74270 [Colletotrichum caudatum]|nr:hypothetical protein LY76DRAFT_74270 [Colletotrichum caudatum]
MRDPCRPKPTEGGPAPLVVYLRQAPPPCEEPSVDPSCGPPCSRKRIDDRQRRHSVVNSIQETASVLFEHVVAAVGPLRLFWRLPWMVGRVYPHERPPPPPPPPLYEGKLQFEASGYRCNSGSLSLSPAESGETCPHDQLPISRCGPVQSHTEAGHVCWAKGGSVRSVKE